MEFLKAFWFHIFRDIILRSKVKLQDLSSSYEPDEPGLRGFKEGGARVRRPAIKGETELDFMNHFEIVDIRNDKGSLPMVSCLVPGLSTPPLPQRGSRSVALRKKLTCPASGRPAYGELPSPQPNHSPLVGVEECGTREKLTCPTSGSLALTQMECECVKNGVPPGYSTD